MAWKKFPVAKIPALVSLMQREKGAKNAPVVAAERALGRNPFRMLVFTMLSARTKDSATLAACKRLFAVAHTPERVAALGEKRLRKLLYGVGFYRVKSRNLVNLCLKLVSDFNSRVPRTLEGLVSLPGVGRKTANIVLARAFGKDVIGVDVHVHRIANMLGLVRTKKPEETEKALMKIVPMRHRRTFNRTFVAYGQTHSLKNLRRDIESIRRQLC